MHRSTAMHQVKLNQSNWREVGRIIWVRRGVRGDRIMAVKSTETKDSTSWKLIYSRPTTEQPAGDQTACGQQLYSFSSLRATGSGTRIYPGAWAGYLEPMPYVFFYYFYFIFFPCSALIQGKADLGLPQLNVPVSVNSPWEDFLCLRNGYNSCRVEGKWGKAGGVEGRRAVVVIKN